MENFVLIVIGILTVFGAGIFVGVKFWPQVVAKEKDVVKHAQDTLRELQQNGINVTDDIKNFVEKLKGEVVIDESTLAAKAEQVLADMKSKGTEITVELRKAADTFIKKLLK